jgi:hypothetical protein
MMANMAARFEGAVLPLDFKAGYLLFWLFL